MTTVPAAIDGLLGLLRASPALTGVRLDDGPWLQRPSEPDVIVVGWLPDELPTVAWVDEIAGLDSEGESYDLQGLASAWNGDSVMRVARDRADVLIEAVRAEVRGDPTLGGAVSKARLVTADMAQYQTGQGCEVAMTYAIRIQVF